MKTNARHPRRPEQGAVLVIVMMVMLGLLGLGVTALWLTSGNLQVGANTNLRNQALYVAEAGIERAREILNGPVPPNLPVLLAGTNAGMGDDVPTLIDGATGLPNGVGAVMVDNAGTALRDVAFPPATFARGTGVIPQSATMGTYTVWIRNDTAEARQNMFTADTNNAVVVRSRGVAPDGKTTVVLEVTMGPGNGGPGAPAGGGLPIPELCYAGKNACHDSSSTVQGIVVAAP
jgi:Tfp pilus assembly protein PilX